MNVEQSAASVLERTPQNSEKDRVVIAGGNSIGRYAVRISEAKKRASFVSRFGGVIRR